MVLLHISLHRPRGNCHLFKTLSKSTQSNCCWPKFNEITTDFTPTAKKVNVIDLAWSSHNDFFVALQQDEFMKATHLLYSQSQNHCFFHVVFICFSRFPRFCLIALLGVSKTHWPMWVFADLLSDP